MKVSRRQFLIEGSAAGLLPLVLQNEAPAQTKDDCVFCGFVANRGTFYKVWEDQNFLAFLDYKPINPGHTLLIPKRHFEYVFELDKPLYEKIFQRAKELAKPLRTAVGSKRIGMMIEGFGVAHAHIHLVPISGSGELIKKGVSGVTAEEFSKMAEKIRNEIMRSK